MKKIISIVMLVSGFSVYAQKFVDGSAPANPNILKQEGQIFSVRLEMGEPIRIFVLGKEEAKIDINDLSLTVKRLKPYPGKILKLDQKDGSYQIAEPMELKGEPQLEVTAQSKDKKEKFKFKLKVQKP